MNHFCTWKIYDEGNLNLVTKDFWFLINQFHHLQYHIQSHYLGHLDPFLLYLLQIKAIWSWLLRTFGSLATSSITLDVTYWGSILVIWISGSNIAHKWIIWEFFKNICKSPRITESQFQIDLRITENQWESISDLFKNHWESPRITENDQESIQTYLRTTKNQFQTYLRITKNHQGLISDWFENHWESTKINFRLIWESLRIVKNHQESLRINFRLIWESPRIAKNHLE